MRANRQPSMYLGPAIHALYQGYLSLPKNHCRALLGLVHFRGFEAIDPIMPGAFSWDLASDEGAATSLTPYPSADAPCGWNFRYPRGEDNYHLVFIEQMLAQDILAVRKFLWPRLDVDMQVVRLGIV